VRDVAHQITFTQLNVDIKAVTQASSVFSKSIKHRPQIAGEKLMILRTSDAAESCSNA
jgi:hypothetical protein